MRRPTIGHCRMLFLNSVKRSIDRFRLADVSNVIFIRNKPSFSLPTMNVGLVNGGLAFFK